MKIDKNNKVWIGNLELSQITKEHGTPLIVYDKQALIDKANIFSNSFKSSKYETQIAFATKAATISKILTLFSKNNITFEVVSPGEIFMVKNAGADMSRVFFHGHSKTISELSFAVENGVGTIVCDNFEELNRINEVSHKYNCDIQILFRVNTDIDARKSIIGSAGEYSRYGEHIGANFDKLSEMLNKNKRIIFRGFHTHIGTQIFKDEPYFKLVDVYKDFIKKFMKDYPGISFDTINFGGGYGARYKDQEYDLSAFLKRFVRKIEAEFVDFTNIKRLVIEPGRALVAEEGLSVYSIDATKRTFDGRNFIYANGGMTDNINPALFRDDRYKFAINGKSGNEYNYIISGKCCESSDTICESCNLPKVEVGDLLITFATGAYTYSEASNYTSLLKPEVIFVDGNKTEVIASRQTLNDLLLNMKK